MQSANNKWEWEIGPKPLNTFASVKSLYAYRHLLSALVRKEFLLNYQQTILGPLWIFFQPVLTLIVYVLVFGKLIGIPIGKATPPVLFYFSGIILWNFFSDSFWGIANTFRDHIHLYSKVYFPRLIVPLSILSTNFLRFIISFFLLALLIVYYAVFKNFSVQSGTQMLALPLLLASIAILSIGCGLITALLSARYRDITNLIGIVLRLLMFVTPVLYPLAAIGDEWKWLVQLNPLSPLFEWFRLILLGDGTVDFSLLVYSFSFGFIILILSLFLFNSRCSKLIDVS